VFLTGFMGAGKSSVGRLLAEKLGLPFFDLDDEIARREGASVASLIETLGEAAFRDAEHAALTDIAASEVAVVACGGGVVLREDNREPLGAGIVVYLAVSAEAAVDRVGDASGRPLLGGLDAEGISVMLQGRVGAYLATADHVIDTVGRTTEDIASAITDALAVGPRRATVRVTGESEYDVIIAESALDRLEEPLAGATDAVRAALICDDAVGDLFAARVVGSLAGLEIPTDELRIEPGEESKTWQTAGTLLEALAWSGLGRDGLVVGLGGGVVGDLAGFCAAVYLRGVPIIHIPTTLLAQVDSSIGGKTGVDLTAGKNLAGVFWPPVLVVSDTHSLRTLPQGEWANGLAEVAKTALLQGDDALVRLEALSGALLRRDDAAVFETVSSCAAFKAGVVSTDVRESGLRECLNLGHTLGHAIERVVGYGAVSHGVAVGEGLRFAARVAAEIVGTRGEVVARTDALLDLLEVPRLTSRPNSAALIDAMRADKKNRGGEIRMVLLSAPGHWEVRPVDESVLLRHLEWWRTDGLKEATQPC
jgi:3-dehydroquinate synthase